MFIYTLGKYKIKNKCLKYKKIMKIFSLKKPVHFCDGQIVVEDLAYNYPYKKINDQLVIEGYDKETQWSYQVFFSLKGELKLVILKKVQHSYVLEFFKEKYELHEIQKIKPNGDVLSVVRKYITTSAVKNKLIYQSFLIKIGNMQQSKDFTLDNEKWVSNGNIPQEQRLLWIG